MNGNKVTAVILAAGSGSRMNSKTTKQRMILGGKSVLQRTVSVFNSCSSVESIIVVVRADELDFAKNELSCFSKVAGIVPGGATRVESSFLGFSAIKNQTGLVAIHDAARCFVTEGMIEAVISDAKRYGAATASAVLTDTVKSVDGEGNIIKNIPRNSLVLVQTPQIFRAEYYKKAIETVDITDASITDDNMLMEKIGIKVHCTDTGKSNIKLTTAEDLIYADYILKKEGN
jgi:2-C-methyl-D-erythritol 4-phosphate cytidylyltransferase